MTKKKRLVSALIITFIVAAGVFFVGSAVFPERSAALGFTVFSIASLMLVAVIFEGSKMSVTKISLVAAMTALSSVSRVAFYAVPFFKPVSAVVIITGMYLGPLGGAICGGASALLSGMFFGYGLWLPFQMLAWGLIGAVAGAIRGPMKKSTVLTCAYGALSGVIFSAVMDIFTVLNFGEFNAEMYAAAVAGALPITAIYAVSNVLFLLILKKPTARIFGKINI